MTVPVRRDRADIWKPYLPGQEELFIALASGLHEFAKEVADGVAAEAPKPSGRPDRPVPYRRTIRATTYMRSRLFAGSDVRNVRDQRRQIYSVVYTPSRLGHFLELGTKPHWMDTLLTANGPIHRRWRHPGAKRKPHFLKGLLKVRLRAGDAISRGARSSSIKVNTRPYTR